jgi:hypothetical protein
LKDIQEKVAQLKDIQQKDAQLKDAQQKVLPEGAKIPLTYKHAYCQINAFINLRHAYKDKDLKVVIGSLGVNGWFEYGGKNWGIEEFKRKMEDVHFWLEDKNGNVYDFLFERYSLWSVIRTGNKLRRTGILEGVSKNELKSVGIEYIPAPIEAQMMLYVNFTPTMVDAEKVLMNGSGRWIEKNGDVYLCEERRR